MSSVNEISTSSCLLWSLTRKTTQVQEPSERKATRISPSVLHHHLQETWIVFCKVNFPEELGDVLKKIREHNREKRKKIIYIEQIKKSEHINRKSLLPFWVLIYFSRWRGKNIFRFFFFYSSSVSLTSFVRRVKLFYRPEGQLFFFWFQSREKRKIENFILLCIRKLHKIKKNFTFFSIFVCCLSCKRDGKNVGRAATKVNVFSPYFFNSFCPPSFCLFWLTTYSEQEMMENFASLTFLCCFFFFLRGTRELMTVQLIRNAWNAHTSNDPSWILPFLQPLHSTIEL